MVEVNDYREKGPVRKIVAGLPMGYEKKQLSKDSQML